MSRCPTCGNENMYNRGQMTQQEYYMRKMIQHQSMNQLAGQGMQNAYTRYGGMAGGGMGDSIDHTKDEQPETPKPEPKPTAWEQFKKAIREVFP